MRKRLNRDLWPDGSNSSPSEECIAGHLFAITFLCFFFFLRVCEGWCGPCVVVILGKKMPDTTRPVFEFFACHDVTTLISDGCISQFENNGRNKKQFGRVCRKTKMSQHSSKTAISIFRVIVATRPDRDKTIFQDPRSSTHNFAVRVLAERLQFRYIYPYPRISMRYLSPRYTPLYLTPQSPSRVGEINFRITEWRVYI